MSGPRNPRCARRPHRRGTGCKDCRYNTRSGCALVLALLGPMTQPEVARLMGITHQRVSQLEISALAKMRAAMEEMR